MISWVVALLLCPCVCCCPCDEQDLYKAPNGQLYSPNGAIMSEPCYAKGL
jgi:hypothetical protein